MASPTQSWKPQKLTTVLLLFCILFSSPVEASTSSKLDQPVVAQPTDTEIKCGSCPCGKTCGEQLPLPSPPPPPPPPAPPKLYPSSQDCNPLPPPPTRLLTPPPPRFIYVTGVPGDVYQTNPYGWRYYYAGAQNRAVGLLVLAGLVAFSVTMVIFG